MEFAVRIAFTLLGAAGSAVLAATAVALVLLVPWFEVGRPTSPEAGVLLVLPLLGAAVAGAGFGVFGGYAAWRWSKRHAEVASALDNST